MPLLRGCARCCRTLSCAVALVVRLLSAVLCRDLRGTRNHGHVVVSIAHAYEAPATPLSEPGPARGKVDRPSPVKTGREARPRGAGRVRRGCSVRPSSAMPSDSTSAAIRYVRPTLPGLSTCAVRGLSTLRAVFQPALVPDGRAVIAIAAAASRGDMLQWVAVALGHHFLGPPQLRRLSVRSGRPALR